VGLTLARYASLVGFAILVFVGVGAGNVAAHAVLLRSTPPTGQTLGAAPNQVQLLFSEPIDPVFSRVHVLDARGLSIDSGDGRVDPDDDHLLVVSLPPGLPNGVYSVSWRSLSTIDVHPDEGEYPLFVGVPATANASLANGTPQISATPETTLGRWWFYLAATLFAGVLAAWKFVLGPVLVGPYADSRVPVRRLAQRFILLGGVLLVVGTLYTALAQAAAAADVPLSSALGQPLADLLLRGRFASIWWPRIGLELVSLLLIGFGGLEGLASECVLATLPAVLLTSSLTSHGAALPSLSAAGIAIDWLHIVGATAWVGGLTGVLIALPVVWRAERSGSVGMLARLLARFGRFAIVAAAVVVLSGAVQAALEVGSWPGMLNTPYGQLVLVKIVLAAGMLVLAGFNEWRGRASASSTPASSAPASRASASGAPASRASASSASASGALAGRASAGRASSTPETPGHLSGLRRGVRAELALGVVVLGVAAVLSGTPPTPTQSPEPGPIPIGQAVIR
jgi:copper transport protein